MAGSEPELFVAIAALVVSIVALSATFMQVIQQYYASASGYSKCNEKVMGGWAKTKSRRFSWDELRYEVQFDAPVIFVAPPTNEFGPVPDAPIYVLDGTDKSMKDTETTTSISDNSKEKTAKERIHTADNERASWLVLLNAVQEMEASSRNWQQSQYACQGPPTNNRPPKPLSLEEHHTLAVAVQRKRRTWDTMPSSVSRPYATTAICHLVEMMAVLGVYWKEFDRNRDRYRAEGNGFMVMGERLRDLGLIFSFQLYGKYLFQENRVIPVDDIKELCFGFVPTIYRKIANRRRLMAEPRNFGYLQMSTRRDISETLVAIGCNKNTAQRFADESSKTAHLFPLSFEILGMVALTFHISNSCFTYLPNPTPDRWKRKSLSLSKILEAYQRLFKKQPSNNAVVCNRITKHIQEILSHQENAPGVARLQALHSALDDADEVLKARANNGTHGSDGNVIDGNDDQNTPQQFRRQMVEDVLRSHIQEVVRLLNDSSMEVSPSGGPRISRFEEIDDASPDDRNDVFMDLYFQVVRQQVVKLAERSATRRGSFSVVCRANGCRQTTDETDSSAALEDDLEPGRTEAQPAANGFEDVEVTPESPGGKEMPSLAEETVSYDDVWCVLIFRMICWLMLHNFNERDVQISKSELVGSRMPVYIS